MDREKTLNLLFNYYKHVSTLSSAGLILPISFMQKSLLNVSEMRLLIGSMIGFLVTSACSLYLLDLFTGLTVDDGETKIKNHQWIGPKVVNALSGLGMVVGFGGLFIIAISIVARQ